MKKLIIGGIAALSMMAMTIDSNSAQGALPFDRLTAADYENAVKEGIRLQNEEIATITANPEAPTFENTIAALDRSGADLTRAALALGNLEHALGDTLLMNALTAVTPIMSQHEASLLLNEPLWKRIKSDARASRTDLSPEQQRLLSETYLQFALNGANLQGSDRDKYRRLNSELSDLNVLFAQNVTNEMASPDAAHALQSEGKADDGESYLITVFYPSYSPFMKYADRRDLREKMYKLYTSRNTKGQYSNVQILKDIANIRLELAQLMGKKTFAEYQLQHTMAGNPQTVNDMLARLTEAYTPAMKTELKEIEEFAQKTEGPDFRLMPWDYSYWSDKLKNERYAFNDEDLRPYFELNNTIKGVFGLATKLYGYTFKENKSYPGYHPDVKVYDVYDRDGKLMGLFLTDFFYRAGKAPGAWMTEFQSATSPCCSIPTRSRPSCMSLVTLSTASPPTPLTPRSPAPTSIMTSSSSSRNSMRTS